MKKEFEKLPLTGWYPGHMLKAGRDMQERLRLVDAVIELLDARLPSTSRNPALAALFGEKPRYLLFNKADLVPPDYAQAWLGELQRQKRPASFVDSLHDYNLQALVGKWRNFMLDVRRKRGSTKPLLRPLRLMIAGVPNVGKSTLINRLCVGKRAAVGPRPGVTRSQQWIRLKNDMELLDTPGVLWPGFDSKLVELKLALAGAIKDELIGEELLAEFLLECLRPHEDSVQWGLYGLDGCPAEVHELLDAVGRRRGLIRAGGVVDTLQSSVALLKDYRDGRLGKIPLDRFPDHES